MLAMLQTVNGRGTAAAAAARGLGGAGPLTRGRPLPR